jgi:hypothetical protein
MNLRVKIKWLFIVLPLTISGQNPLIYMDFGYGIMQPAGKLNDRFGSMLHPHFSIGFQPRASSFLMRLEGQYFFGSMVKTDVLQNLRTIEGYLVGNDGSIADMPLRGRGYYAGASVEKIGIFSNFFLGLGSGFLQHKIRIQKDPLTYVPQLEGAYEKGYDRLTSGLGIKSYLGYRYLSDNRRINFSFTLYSMVGFTELRRSIQFDIKGKPPHTGPDFLTGIKLTWILPLYFDDPDLIFY